MGAGDHRPPRLSIPAEDREKGNAKEQLADIARDQFVVMKCFDPEA